MSSQHGARQKGVDGRSAGSGRGAMRCWRWDVDVVVGLGFTLLVGSVVSLVKRRNSKVEGPVELCEGSGTAESRRVTRLGKRGNRDGLTRDWLKILSCKHSERAFLAADWSLGAKMPRIVDAKRRMCPFALFLFRQVSCLFCLQNPRNPQNRYLFFSTDEEP